MKKTTKQSAKKEKNHKKQKNKILSKKKAQPKWMSNLRKTHKINGKDGKIK